MHSVFIHLSVLLNEDGVIVRRDSPVLRVIVFIWVILLVISKESIELDALFEIFDSFKASDVFEVLEITEGVNAGSDESMPVDALELHVGVVLLELDTVQGLLEVNIWSLDGVHVFTGHFELVEIEVLGEYLHI